MTRRFMCVLLALAFVVAALSGCATGGGTAARPTGQGEGTFDIVATFYPIYIMTLNVAGGIPGVTVSAMTQPTAGCLHDYSATADDMRKLEGAEALVANGAGMESFQDKVLGQFPALPIIEATRGIELVTDENGEGNPHVWVSLTLAIRQVRTIAAELAKLDPAHAGQYEAKAAAYEKRLEALRDRMHKALDGLPNRDIVTFHEAFPYFAQEFSLNIVAVVEREPGSEPSARELSDTIDAIRELKVKAMFAEPQYPATAAETIARETGCRLYQLDPAVTGPMEADAYLDIMESNLTVLQEALQ